jgi:glycosyltransferase involved in cell wall biosynthesis
MKILLVCPYTPYPLTDGGKVRVYNLIKRLSVKHDITLICFTKNKQEEIGIAELKNICKKVEAIRRRSVWSPINFILAFFTRYPMVFVVNGFSWGLENLILNELQNEKYDMIQVEHSYAAANVIKATNKSGSPILKVLSEHNIESQIYERYLKVKGNVIMKLLLAIDIFKLKRAQARAWHYFDLCVFASENDMNYFKRIYPKKRSALIPNGDDIELFKIGAVREKEVLSMIFVGNFKYMANIDAMQFFIEMIFPLIKKDHPAAKLSIVGNDPFGRAKRFKNADVRVTGYVDDTGYYLSQSQVFVAPLRIGSGTKLKILEAMATGLPVVGTSIAFEGIDVKNGEDVLIADGPERFASSVSQLFKDEELGKKLGENARRLIEKSYDWDKIAERLDALYSKWI